MRWRTFVRLSASLVLGGFFLWRAVAGIDAQQVGLTLRALTPGLLLAYAATLVAVQFLRAWRWAVLVAPFAPLRPAEAFRISNVGNMLIMLLPLRLGELARPYLMQQHKGAPMSRSLGAAVVERILDGLLVSLLFFVTVRLLPPPYRVDPALRRGAQLALAVFAGTCALLGLALASRQRLFALLRRGQAGRLGAPLARLEELLAAFLAGLQALPNLQAGLALTLSTLGYWAANGLGLWCLCGAFGWNLPPVSGFLLMCVLVIGIMIPGGPGCLGTFQVALMAGLRVFDVGPNPALAYSLVAHLINLAVVVGFGVPHLLGRGCVDVRAVVGASAAPDPRAPDASR